MAPHWLYFIHGRGNIPEKSWRVTSFYVYIRCTYRILHIFFALTLFFFWSSHAHIRGKCGLGHSHVGGVLGPGLRCDPLALWPPLRRTLFPSPFQVPFKVENPYLLPYTPCHFQRSNTATREGMSRKCCSVAFSNLTPRSFFLVPQGGYVPSNNFNGEVFDIKLTCNLFQT
ncbi:hypothetical protein SCLCIDRAFT_753545 [Scleroderma citrinum Foug A]|uniref:Uncharacterized protein n=1 Tax=Scleroderma citrinum Foug A TaxID=1036808 RepID=A0A0C2ZP47_9AGAM|nr:hypothetical protein SCLCIDRAFT_753545 [Scleroderma citrinum Foug A]